MIGVRLPRGWGKLLVVLAAGVLLVALFVGSAGAAVSWADISPDYRADPAWDFDAFWTLSWEATGTNLWTFLYGDGDYVQYMDTGNGMEFPAHPFEVWCGTPLYKYKYQSLKIGSTTYATSTVKLTKTSEAC